VPVRFSGETIGALRSRQHDASHAARAQCSAHPPRCTSEKAMIVSRRDALLALTRGSEEDSRSIADEPSEGLVGLGWQPGGTVLRE
jgi:hypothetical protein